MKYKLTLNLEWIMDFPDDVDDLNVVEREDALLDLLSENIESNNETVENLFWEGIVVEEVK